MDQEYRYDSPSFTNESPVINYRKDLKKGIKFTFMVVGELGTGKTTFVNTLLNKQVLQHRYAPQNNSVAETKTLAFSSAKSVALPSTSILTRNDFNPANALEEPGIALTETRIEMIDEDNTKLLLTVIDTPGFGENLNNEMCFVEIENFLKQQFDLVLAEETRIRRNPRFEDTRVHVLLYFIAPTGHGLREIDITCMKRLSRYVNIIPVIGRADSFTEQELQTFKDNIKVDIEKFNVPIFQFDNYLNEYDENEDYELIEECKYLARLQPFAVIASEEQFEIKDPNTGHSKVIRGRQYPWGIVDINDSKYSDFPILRSVLLGTHLQDLKDLTHDFLYETYRTERLTKVAGGNAEDEPEESEFHDSVEQPTETKAEDTTVPSMSNLAEIATSNPYNNTDDTISLKSSTSSKKPKSMLFEDSESADGHSTKVKDDASFISSNSTISLDNLSATRSLNSNNATFKRLSIAPQRNQLRQISETVPYVIRHERIAERQQKLEEMEMSSAKELANRAILLEKKAAELKAKEKALMKRLEEERLRKMSSETDKEYSQDPDISLSRTSSIQHSTIKKEETLTDLHSIVNESQDEPHS